MGDGDEGTVELYGVSFAFSSAGIGVTAAAQETEDSDEGEFV
jgi:hypothetical protein